MTPDARAVVAAVDRLTTQLSAQLSRLADTRQTPTDAPTTTCRAMYARAGLLTTRCIRPANHAFPRHTDSAGSNWSDAVAIYPADDAPSTTCDASTLGIANRHLGPCVLRDGHDGPVHRGPEGETWATVVATVGDGPTTADDEPVTVVGQWHPMSEQLAEEMNEHSSLIQQWAAGAVAKARAEDEEQQRTARRVRLHNLLARADRGHLTPGEVAALRELAAAETRDADTARTRAAQAEDLQHIAHETSNRAEAERARAVERVDRAEATLAEARADYERMRELLRVENKRANDAIARECTAEQAAEEQRERAEQLAAVLREVLGVFSPMKDTHDGPVAYYDGAADIEPKRYERWRAVLDGAGQPEPSTAKEG
ncbi:hypothetical protein [Streptomyces albogriseolus]|uniref:hypothetical protein n=1 Tax=Streptomyces albogriseolus TaxID=1887 RepID=UPI00368D8758